MKDHELRELVNALTATAMEFSGTQQLRDRIAGIVLPAIDRLRADEKRIDWLSDKDNHIGNVQLPTKCVMENPSSLRAAIDAAMDLAPNVKLRGRAL